MAMSSSHPPKPGRFPVSTRTRTTLGPAARTRAIAVACALALASCAEEASDSGGGEEDVEDATRVESPDARIVALLRDGQPVFGIFSGDHTPESGAAMAEVRETDFVFYSLESGPFDLPAMGAYADAMTEAAGVDDIAERLGQGFRVIIVTQPEALSAGRAAAGRTDLD